MPGAHFGTSIDIDGQWAIIGSPNAHGVTPNAGAAYVFRRTTGNQWLEHQRLVAPDGASEDEFGGSVAISGGALLVSARRDDDAAFNAGAVYAFVLDAATGVWNLESKLLAPDGGAADQLFGGGLRLDGSVFAAGARLTIDTSIVHVFRRSSLGVWDCEASIASPTGDAQDRFGWTFDVAGDVLAVGAHHAGDHQVLSGAVYVYRRSGTSTSWQLESDIEPPGGDMIFGASVALSGDHLAVGSLAEYTHPLYGTRHGLAIRTFRYQVKSGEWETDGVHVSTGQSGDPMYPLSGKWIAMDGDAVVRGDTWPYNDYFGMVRVLARDPQDNWLQTSQHFPLFTPPQYCCYGSFGRNVALGDGIFMVGDPFSEVPAGGVGQVYVYQYEGLDCNDNQTCDAGGHRERHKS